MYSIASPTQARSKKALERFLNVAAELLANNQFEETGISQIAQLAESSVGTFYRLLGELEAVGDRLQHNDGKGFYAPLIRFGGLNIAGK